MRFAITNYVDLLKIHEKYKGLICIFGAGLLGTGDAYKLIKCSGFSVDYYFDNYVMDKQVVNGIPLKNVDYLYGNKEQIFVFLCVGTKFQPEIIKQFTEHNITDYAIIDFTTIWLVLDSIDKADSSVKAKYKELYDDKQYIESKYLERVGKKLNLNTPSTFNEKLQFLKLRNRNPEYINMVDKYEAKEIVKKKIGADYIIPTYGIWDSFDEIDINSLPSQFVIKCTHDSGSVMICRDKNIFDWEKAKRQFSQALKINCFWQSREWPYKNVKPRIIAEKYIEDDEWSSLPVYKFFCFSGTVGLIQFILNDKAESETVDYYDVHWNKLCLHQNYPNSKVITNKPEQLDTMLNLASLLSTDIPFVRVDFYCVSGQIYFSEFTFFSDSGFERFYPDEWDDKLGKMMDIGRA